MRFGSQHIIKGNIDFWVIWWHWVLWRSIPKLWDWKLQIKSSWNSTWTKSHVFPLTMEQRSSYLLLPDMWPNWQPKTNHWISRVRDLGNTCWGRLNLTWSLAAGPAGLADWLPRWLFHREALTYALLDLSFSPQVFLFIFMLKIHTQRKSLNLPSHKQGLFQFCSGLQCSLSSVCLSVCLNHS